MCRSCWKQAPAGPQLITSVPPMKVTFGGLSAILILLLSEEMLGTLECLFSCDSLEFVEQVQIVRRSDVVREMGELQR